MSDLFADQAPPQGTPPQGALPSGNPPVTDQVASPFNALVGDAGKYKTSDDLAKAYLHADQFIEQLKNENAELRKQAQAAKSIDEVLEQLKHKPEVAETTPQFTADDIASIVQQQITGLETAKTRQSNLSKADQAMKAKYGDKAVEVYQAKANTPQLQKIYKELAEVDPDQFVALFGAVAEVTPKGTLDSSTVNSASAASAPRVKEWSKDWVAHVRKNDPARYKSQQFQQDMIANASKYFN